MEKEIKKEDYELVEGSCIDCDLWGCNCYKLVLICTENTIFKLRKPENKPENNLQKTCDA